MTEQTFQHSELQTRETHSSVTRKGTNFDGQIRFLHAVIKGNEKKVLELIKAGVDVNFAYNQEKSVLFYAVIHKNERLINALIEAGAYVNITDDEGKTPLFYCAGSRDTYEFRKLKKVDDEHEVIDPVKAVASVLINAGADINVTDDQGQSALICAARINNESLVYALITAGADVNVSDKQGRTALIYAVSNIMLERRHFGMHFMSRYPDNHEVINDSKKSIVCKLVKAGADINTRDKLGKTALIYCGQKGNESMKDMYMYVLENHGEHAVDYKSLSSLLVNAGADVNITDNEGKNALMYSLQNKCENLVCSLIDAGVDVNETDKQGRTALIYYARDDMENSEYRMYHEFCMSRYQIEHEKTDTIGYKSVVPMLIQAGADVNIADDHGQTALIYSLKNNNKSLASALIESGADVNVIDCEGKTALFYAAIYSYKSFDHKLLNASTNSNITDQAALLHAVQLDRESIVTKLIRVGANVNKTDNQGKTALMYYAKNDSQKILRKAPRKIRKCILKYCIHHAAAIDYKNVAFALIEASSDLNITDDQGKTALAYFLQNNKKWCVLALLNAGAEINKIDSDGKTLLFYVPTNCEKSIIDELMKTSIDINTKDDEGQTALIDAVAKNNDYLSNALIDAGADVNITDDQGKTALMYCVQHNRTSLSAKLVHAGADVNITDKEGKTALIYSVQDDVERKQYRMYLSYQYMYKYFDVHMETDAVDYKSVPFVLIKAGADVNITDNQGKTALIYCLQNNNKSLSFALIEAGADVNVIDGDGKTALLYAVTCDKNIVQALIKAGADVNITDNQDKTALIYCAEHNKKDRMLVSLMVKSFDDYYSSIDTNNYKNIASMLIKAGADVNKSDHEGGTALSIASGDEDFVLVLISDRDVLIDKRDRFDRSPIFYAFTKSLASARLLLDKGSNLIRKDRYNASILSFFIEHCLKRSNNPSFCSSLYDGLKLLQEKGVQQQKIFVALINSVICRILLTTEESKVRKQEYDQCFKKTNIDKIINILNLAKKYGAEKVDKKDEVIERILMMIKEGKSLYTEIPKILDSLNELGANLNYADSYGNTALHYAICLPVIGVSQKKTMDICLQLDDLGLSVHAKNHNNETPLLYCLSRRDWIKNSHKSSRIKILINVCKFLLEHGSSVEDASRSEKSVFHLTLKLFQQAVGLRDDTLRKEVLNETLTLLQLFSSSRVTKGVTVNRRDGDLNSPLHLWAMLELNLPSENDSSANEHSALDNKLFGSIFEHLLACGAKVNDRNGTDQTPLHLCKTWTSVRLLIDAGANPNVVDSIGSSPLLVAVQRDNFLINNSCVYQGIEHEPKEFWKDVIEKKLDPWTVNNHGKSVMSILVRSEAFNLAKALLEVACESAHFQSDETVVSLLNAICKDTSTRAHWKSILVELILKSKKNPIIVNDGEDTPLHFCCKNIVKRRHTCVKTMMTFVQWTIIKQLLSHGADCNVLNASGQSCLGIAKKCPVLKDLLRKPINMGEVPLFIPWTSISKTHEHALAKVARRQECRHVSSFWYHQRNIQKGAFGLVFVGISEKDGREVAIKRTEKLRMHRPEDKREITSLTTLADCEQVVRYLSFFEDEDFSYIVLELMEGNLNDYLGGNPDVKRSVQLCGDVVTGLKYLHERSILHRDLKPSNILFKTFPKLCLKIADFGLSRRMDKCSSSTTVYGSVAGTRCWIAPEVLNSSYQEHSMASDVFSCGLLLHYVLLVKKHPYSPVDCTDKSESQINNETETNILKNSPEGWDKSLNPEATELIKGMLDNDRRKRPTAAEALTHPFFWAKKKKMDLLIAVGNQPEIETPRAKKSSPLSAVEKDLEKRFCTIIKHATWDDSGYAHMPAIYTEMTQKRKPYNTHSAVELVRFIRNAYAHVSEDKRPSLIRKLVLEDFVFLEYFPNLVMEVLNCIKTHGWDSREEIKYALD